MITYKKREKIVCMYVYILCYIFFFIYILYTNVLPFVYILNFNELFYKVIVYDHFNCMVNDNITTKLDSIGMARL